MLYMKEMRAKVVAECTLKESAAINQILGRRVSSNFPHFPLKKTVKNSNFKSIKIQNFTVKFQFAVRNSICNRILKLNDS